MWSSPLVAQSETAAQPGILFSFGYGPQFPGGDLAERFGNSWSLRGNLDYLTRSRWQFGAQAQYFFGTEVKEDVLAGLRTEAGFIIGNQRSPADIQLRQRGLFLGLQAGRNFVLNPSRSQSGLQFSLAAGWLLHRIRIQTDPAQTVNQVIAEYQAGYDRLTAGPALHQFFGYQNLDPRGRLNFYVGVELMEGFTQSQRDWDFATQGPLSGNRFEILFGVRAGWILPFYQGAGAEIYY